MTVESSNARLNLDDDTVSFAVDKLVSAAKNGSVPSFERLYRLYSRQIFGLCLRMTRQQETAEDCVQSAFISAWRNLHKFENRSAFSTWLHGIAVNAVLTHRRSSKPWLQFEERFADGEFEAQLDKQDETIEPFDANDVMDVERALMTLPDGARHVIVLQAIYGYSHEEVAGMLNIAVGTCKAQLHRARRMLNERLGLAQRSTQSGT